MFRRSRSRRASKRCVHTFGAARPTFDDNAISEVGDADVAVSDAANPTPA